MDALLDMTGAAERIAPATLVEIEKADLQEIMIARGVADLRMHIVATGAFHGLVGAVEQVGDGRARRGSRPQIRAAGAAADAKIKLRYRIQRGRCRSDERAYYRVCRVWDRDRMRPLQGRVTARAGDNQI